MVAIAHSNYMTEQEFQDHTKQITLRVIQLVEMLPNTRKAQTIGSQLLNCVASIGAKYRAACKGRSTEDLIRNLRSVEDEAGKSLYWLDILVEAGIIDRDVLARLLTDLQEIETITAHSIKTLDSNLTRKNIKLRL